MEWPLQKIVSIGLMTIVFVIVLLGVTGNLKKAAEAGFGVLGIDLFGDSTVYIKDLEAKVDGNTIELSWTVPEGKKDAIFDYKLYVLQRHDLKEDQKALVTGDFYDWTESGTKKLSDEKWVFSELDNSVYYGWYVFRLVAVTRTSSELDENEDSIWIPHEADNECSDDSCYHDAAVRYKNSILCNRIESRLVKEKCYHDVAVSTGDEGICEASGAYLKDDCYRDLAISKLNAELCAMIGKSAVTQKDSCYEEIAIETKNAELCDNIREGFGDECYNQIAIDTTNKELCKKISLGARRRNCESQF